MEGVRREKTGKVESGEIRGQSIIALKFFKNIIDAVLLDEVSLLVLHFRQVTPMQVNLEYFSIYGKIHQLKMPADFSFHRSCETIVELL